MKSGITWARRQAARSVQSVEQAVNARRGAAWGASPRLETPHTHTLSPTSCLARPLRLDFRENSNRGELETRLDAVQPSIHPFIVLMSFYRLYVNYPFPNYNYIHLSFVQALITTRWKFSEGKKKLDQRKFNSPTVWVSFSEDERQQLLI